MELILLILIVVWCMFLHNKITTCEKTLIDIKNQFLENKQTDSITSVNSRYSISGEEKIPENIETVSVQAELSDKDGADKKLKEKLSFENMFLGNIFGIIGALAVISGCAVFIKLISPFIIYTPFIKTIIGFILGITMILGGLSMKRESLKRYSEIFTGCGFAVLFTTVYLTTALFKTFSPAVCILLATLTLVAAYYIADKQKTVSMIMVALVGGYLNIFFAGLASNSNLTFEYIIFLNLLSVLYTYKNPEKSVINVINLIAAFCCIIYRQILSLFSAESFSISILFPIMLWLIYLIYDFVQKRKRPDSADENMLLNWVNFFVYIIFTLLILRDNRWDIGILLLSAGLIYGWFIFYFVKKKSKEFRPYVHLMLIAALFSGYFMTEEISRIILWSVEALTLGYVLYKYKQNYLCGFILLFISAAALNIFFIDDIIFQRTYIPIFNVRFTAFIYPVLTAYLTYLLIRNNPDNIVKKLSENLRIIYISLIYLYVVFEINNFFTAEIFDFNTDENFIKTMLYATIGFKYSTQMYKISQMNKNIMFKIFSGITGFAALIMLIAYGREYTPVYSFIPVLNMRFIAYTAAIISAVAFSKWCKSISFKYLALFLGFILLHVEVTDCICKFNLSDVACLTSVIWLVYAGIITFIGILNKQKYLKNTGILISILAIIKVIFIDLSEIDMIYKLIIFISAGVILMFTSYFYNKNKS